MKGIPQGRYTREFRQEAVKLVTEEKLSLPEAAHRLSLAPSTLSYWVKGCKAGKLEEIQMSGHRGQSRWSKIVHCQSATERVAESIGVLIRTCDESSARENAP